MSETPYDWSGHPPVLRRLAETFDHPAQRAPRNYLLRLADQIESRLADDELLRYAALLAWIMDSEDDRAEVEDTAVHVWRVELAVEDHARLARFLPDELRDEAARL
jgi:hypothetical protein